MALIGGEEVACEMVSKPRKSALHPLLAAKGDLARQMRVVKQIAGRSCQSEMRTTAASADAKPPDRANAARKRRSRASRGPR